MKIKRIIFLTEDQPGGASTNKRLLEGLLASLKQIVVVESLPSTDIPASTGSGLAFYFQDQAKISGLKSRFPEAKFFLECHILNSLRLSYFLPSLREDYDVINKFRKIPVPPASISEEIFEMKLRASAEKPLFELADLIISNSPSTTSRLKSLQLPGGIVDTTLTNHLIKPGSQIHRSREEFLFFNPPTISKGFHYLLSTEDDPPIDVWGNSPREREDYDLEKLRAKKIRLHGRIETLELVSESIAPYRFALFPSLYESRCLALDECLRLGIIPFCQITNPGFTDQVSHGVNGFLIDFRQKNWSSEIRRLTQSLSLSRYLEMVQNATQTASKLPDRNELILSELKSYI